MRLSVIFVMHLICSVAGGQEACAQTGRDVVLTVQNDMVDSCALWFYPAKQTDWRYVFINKKTQTAVNFGAGEDPFRLVVRVQGNDFEYGFQHLRALAQNRGAVLRLRGVFAEQVLLAWEWDPYRRVYRAVPRTQKVRVAVVLEVLR